MMFLCLSILIGTSTGAPAPTVTYYQTSENTSDRLTPQSSISFTQTPRATSSPSSFSIKIDPEQSAQIIEGFGGALTQSSASVYNDLPEELQEQLIEAYYGETGIKFSTGRLPIHSCDFSPETYTFDDTEGDKELDDFDIDIAYDQKVRKDESHDVNLYRTLTPLPSPPPPPPPMQLSLPLIKAAVAANPSLKLFGSPWSPPAWMKDNNNMLGGGSLLPEYARTWAEYFSKWITSYKKQGVEMWGVTVQVRVKAGAKRQLEQHSTHSSRLALRTSPRMRQAGRVASTLPRTQGTLSLITLALSSPAPTPT